MDRLNIAKMPEDVNVLLGFRNKLINPDFDVNARGLSYYTAGGFTLDHWTSYIGGGTMTVVPRAFNADVAPGVGQGGFGVNVSTAGAGIKQFYQKIEGVNTLANGRASLDFWVYATVAGVELDSLVALSYGTGGSPVAYPSVVYRDTTTAVGWKKCTVVFDMPTVSGKVVGSANYVAVYLFSTATPMSITISRVSFVAGDTRGQIDPFEDRPTSIERLLCKRYYAVITSAIFLDGNAGVAGVYVSSLIHLPVPMRVTPTTGIFVSNSSNLQQYACTMGSPDSGSVSIRSLATGRFYSTIDRLTFDAEI